MKKIWRIIIVLGLAGVLFMTVGYFMGAKMQMTLDRKGFHVGDATKAPDIREPLGEFEDITIRATHANVELILSDKYYIEIVGDDEYSIHYEVRGGELVVTQENIWVWNILKLSLSGPQLKIYVPKDASLNNVFVGVSSGSASLSGLHCNNLNAELASGSIRLADIAADTLRISVASGRVKVQNATADRLNISVKSGSIDARGIRSKKLDVDISSGFADISGVLEGENNISVKSGSAKLDIQGRKSDYNRFISVKSGSVRVNGKKEEGGERYAKAKNSITVNVNSGMAKVDFSKD